MLKKIFSKNTVIDLLFELAGSFLVAVAIYNFASPARFPMTGFSGLALILHRLFSLPIGATIILMNIPLALFTYKTLGHGFFFRSIRCMILSSLMLDFVAPLLPVYEGERLLAAVCIGVLSGFGYSLIYMRRSSTGGSDFIIMSLKKRRPHLSIGKIAFFCDAVIVLAGGILYQDMDGMIYGLMINYVVSLVVDRVMYGMNAGKMALIVTENGLALSEAIDVSSGRGSTILPARGGYSSGDKQVVMCACSNKEMYEVEKAVKQVDPDCFIIILESNEVVGDGFITRRH